MKKTALGLALILGFASAHAIQPDDPQQEFWDNLSALCGKAFSGELAAYAYPMDSGWRGEEVTMHVRECSEDEIKIPLHIGDNRSRTWILTRIDDGIRLKHDHRLEDGSEDEVTWYGGHTTDPGRGWRQSFPVDAYSQGLFYSTDLQVSVTNVWTMEVHPDDIFAYELTRPYRHLRVEFDLTDEVDAPPAPWGHE